MSGGATSPVRIGIVIGVFAVLGVVLLVLMSPARLDSREPVRIGVISLTDVDTATFRGLRDGMADLGYREGQEVVYRSPGPAQRIDRLDSLIDELLQEGIDLLFVSSTPGTQAAKRATADGRLPVVFAPVNDPIDAGVVTSLKRPGGNITGVRLPTGEGRRLRWLVDIASNVRRVHFPYNPNDASARATLEWVRQVAEPLGVELMPASVEDPAAVEADAAALPPEIDAVFLPRDSTVESRIERYVASSVERRIPLAAPSSTQAEAGALFSYGFVHYEIGRQAARMVDQILDGVPPGEIPVESAESYLHVNLKTARALGLEIPTSVLYQADGLIR